MDRLFLGQSMVNKKYIGLINIHLFDQVLKEYSTQQFCHLEFPLKSFDKMLYKRKTSWKLLTCKLHNLNPSLCISLLFLRVKLGFILRRGNVLQAHHLVGVTFPNMYDRGADFDPSALF